MFKKIFLLASVLCLLQMAYAQNQTITILGYVHDADDNPVEMVNIVIEKSTHGTTTDANGIFKLTTPKTPLKLIFSHVSYKKQEMKITKAALEEASETGVLTLDIRMESNVKMLPAVSISDSKIQMAYQNKKAWILDYELADNYLILLLLEGNKKMLRVVEEGNESNYLEKEIAKDCQSLYKDCFGSLHLIAKDSVYQAFFSDSTIIIPYSAPIKSFYQFIKPCQIAMGDKWVYQKYSGYNQVVTYTLMDIEKKTEALLASAVNEEQRHAAQLLARDIFGTEFQQEYYRRVGQYFEDMPSFDAFPPMEELHAIGATDATALSSKKKAAMDAQAASFEQRSKSLANFFFSALCKPTYQPIKYINQKICLFNHYEGKIFAFDEDGNPLSEQTITYQNDKQWAKEIIVNEEHTRCFAKYIKDGMVTLHEIDLDTGQIKSSLTLDEHAFPEKIRIKGDFVYYTYKEALYSDENKRYLWKRMLGE